MGTGLAACPKIKEENIMKIRKISKLIALVCVLAMLFSLTGCFAQKYVFEAEYAIVADGNGMWPPNLEKETTDDEGNVSPGGLSNVSDGSTVTWKIVSDKAETATVTLNVASFLKNWGAEVMGSTIGIPDMTQALALTVNGVPVTITGSIPDGDSMEVYPFEFEVELVAGENTFVVTALGTGETVNLFLDNLTIQTNAELTFTETDNSDRIWQMIE